jgi:hypothetical protein
LDSGTPRAAGRVHQLLRQFLTGYSKEIHASLIESDSKVLMEVRMQIAGSSQADLIEHATQVDDSIGNNGTLRVDSERPSHRNIRPFSFH